MNFNTNNQPVTMGDKEMMDDSLSSEKMATDGYNTTANECATPNIRNEILNILSEEHQIQADIFNEMSKRGWYPTEPAEQQKVEQAKQKFQNMNS